MQRFQAAILLEQMEKLVVETARRRENADYLAARLKEVPGIEPARLPENSRAVWHLFPLRYDPQRFNGLTRERLTQALQAEGIPCGGGYTEQYLDGLLDEAIESRGFKRLFSAERLKAYRQSLQDLKGNRQVCATTIGMGQNLLLGSRRDMDDIIEALRKVQAHSAALTSA
jgi:dTDP-4-amino-4,6-dideoxygalactose transaminase